MTWPFVFGQTYNRRDDVHRLYSGQQQGGIITPARTPLVILITGKKGRDHGYVDTWRPDGIFEYVGEGQRGDMRLNKGNLAIANHYEAGKDLLVFTKLGGGAIRFEGDFICIGYRVERRPDKDRQLRDAFVFELCPVHTFERKVDESEHIPPTGIDLSTLRSQALLASESHPNRRATTRNIFARSSDVRAYVLARAEGRCEGCTQPAPFERLDGSPYLEAHHTLRLCDAGPDHPSTVIALCPNCHRRVHHGWDGRTYNDELIGKVKEIEPHS